MEFTLTSIQKCETLANIFQNIKIFTEHLQLRFSPEQLHVQGMDNSHVSLYEIAIPANWFTTYKCEKNITLGINTNILFKILSAREKTQEIHMQNKSDAENIFVNFINGKDKTDFDRHFEMPLIDLTTDMWEIPEIEYQAEFTLSAAKFASVVAQLKMFGDTMEFMCSEETIKITSDSNCQGKMSVDINIGELSSYAVEEGGQLKVSYSLNYVYNICLFHKISKDIEISLVDNNPMKITYEIDGAKVLFYLAPKIGEED
jgi:proliferating cell nuclear antigen